MLMPRFASLRRRAAPSLLERASPVRVMRRDTPPGQRRASQRPQRLPHQAKYRAASLFDDLVGASQDGWRNGVAECLRGPKIDHQLEPGRLLDRQIVRLGALLDFSGVNANLAKKHLLSLIHS